MRSFGSTLWRSALWPWRFWRDVSPAHRVGVGRLLLYWKMVNLPLVLLTTVAIGADLAAAARDSAADRAVWAALPGRPGSVVPFKSGFAYKATPAELDVYAPRPWSWAMVAGCWRWPIRNRQGPLLAVAAVAAAWPWATAAALLAASRWSLRRAKVDVRHCLRTAVYAADVGLLALVVAIAVYGPGSITVPVVNLTQPWLPPTWASAVPSWATAGGLQTTRCAAPFAVAWSSTSWSTPYRTTGPLGRAGVPLLVVVVVPFAVVAAVRLTIANRRYLRLRHPLATAVAVQLIVTLAVVVAVLRLG